MSLAADDMPLGVEMKERSVKGKHWANKALGDVRDLNDRQPLESIKSTAAWQIHVQAAYPAFKSSEIENPVPLYTYINFALYIILHRPPYWHPSGC
jgi:hypothetical protein